MDCVQSDRDIESSNGSLTAGYIDGTLNILNVHVW